MTEEDKAEWIETIRLVCQTANPLLKSSFNSHTISKMMLYKMIGETIFEKVKCYSKLNSVKDKPSDSLTIQES